MYQTLWINKGQPRVEFISPWPWVLLFMIHLLPQVFSQAPSTAPPVHHRGFKPRPRTFHSYSLRSLSRNSSIDPKYRNVSFLGTTWHSKLISSFSRVVVPKSHLIYSLLLSLKPLDSKVSRHNSSFWFTHVRLSSTSTTSSAKSIHQGMSPCMSLVTSSITKANK